MRLYLLILLLAIMVGCAPKKPGQPYTKEFRNGLPKDSVLPKHSKYDNRYMTFIDSIGGLQPGISKFIPDDYEVLDTAMGDLNMDGINDLLLVIRKKTEDTLTYGNYEYAEKRPLLVLIRQTDSSYNLERENDSAVMCINCGEIVRSDPFTGLKIKNGYFSVEHGVAEGGQHWRTVTTFKYDKTLKEWLLYKIGSETGQINDKTGPDEDAMKWHEDMKTKKNFGTVPFENYGWEMSFK